MLPIPALLLNKTTLLAGAAAAVVGLALLAGRYHTARVDSLQLQISGLKQERDQATAAREQAVRAHVQQIAALTNRHAVQQQEKEDAFNQNQAALQRTVAADAAVVRGLRQRLEASTSRGGRVVDPTDTVACQRDADRLEALGRLAGEGMGLLDEARQLLRQRDTEVTGLLDQIRIDRAAVGALAP